MYIQFVSMPLTKFVPKFQVHHRERCDVSSISSLGCSSRSYGSQGVVVNVVGMSRVLSMLIGSSRRALK